MMTNSPLHTHWAWAVSTFFGAGRLKPGPGTWGSLGAAALWYAAARLAHRGTTPVNERPRGFTRLTLVAALSATAVGIPASSRVARESRCDDPGFVVIDEVAGQWLALAFARPTLGSTLLALGLFRLFDITKPWPARQLEALPEGWGIMLDDLAAGAYAMLTLSLIEHRR
jgi:phosphatidylglycerophosphatase A